jgi:hypothetical protein
MKLYSFAYVANIPEVCRRINEWCPEVIPGIIHMSYKPGVNVTMVVYRAEQNLWAQMQERHLQQQREEYDERGEPYDPKV